MVPATDARNATHDDLRVLIVDDVRDAADSLVRLLQVTGVEARAAYSAAEALGAATDFEPHCVVLDLIMPPMSGGELARTLRERYGDAIVLIAVTGDQEVDMVTSVQVRDVDHCLRKPVHLESLTAILYPDRIPPSRRRDAQGDRRQRPAA